MPLGMVPGGTVAMMPCEGREEVVMRAKKWRLGISTLLAATYAVHADVVTFDNE
jgi:hypothetical protein